MTERSTIVHSRIMIGALIVSVAALPFSVKICHGAIIVLLLNWLCEGSWRAKVAIIRHSVLLQLIITVFLLQVIGLAFSGNVLRGWYSVEKKLFFILLPLALATSAIRLQRKQLTLIFSAFVLSCFVGTLICVAGAGADIIQIRTSGIIPHPVGSDLYLAAASDDSPYWYSFSYIRLAEHIGIHPTYFSLYLAVSVLLMLDFLPTVRQRALKIPMLLLILYFTIFIMLLSSRIVIIGTCIMYIWIFVRSFVERRLSLGLIAVAASALFILVLFVNPVTRYRNLDELNSLTYDIEPGENYTTAAQIRLSLWWVALNSLKNANPLVGFGTGDVHKAMATTSVSYHITNVIGSFDPHNQYLYTLLANGVPALIMLLLYMMIPAWWAWMKGDTLLLGFIFIFALVCMTESALELQKGIAFYALMSGMLCFHRHSFQTNSVNFRFLLRVSEERR